MQFCVYAVKRKAPPFPDSVLTLQKDDPFEEFSKILVEEMHGETADLVFHLDGGDLRGHKLALCPKSPLIASIIRNFPPGFEFHFSCPDVSASMFRHIVDLIYLGKTRISCSKIEEFKSVAKTFMISLEETNITKNEEEEDMYTPVLVFERFLGEAEPKRKRGRPKRSEVPIEAINAHRPSMDEEECKGPSTRKKVIDFRSMEMLDYQSVYTINPSDVKITIGDEGVQNDSDYEPFCSPVPAPELEYHYDQELIDDDVDSRGYGMPLEDLPADDDNDSDWNEKEDPEEESSTDEDFDPSHAGSSTKTPRKRKEPLIGEHVCVICKNKFDSTLSLRNHNNETHKKDGKFFCPECDHTTNSMSALLTHRRRHTGERPFECKFCGRRFSHNSTLNEHMNLHTGNKPFKCDECGAAFTQRKKLQYHRCSSPYFENDESSEPRYTCPDCGRKFFNKKGYAHHRFYHLEKKEKPKDNLCEVCGKGFSTKYLLKAHMGIHEERNIYTCDICGRGYISKRSLENHIMQHTGEYPFQCSQCDRKFKDQIRLTCHEQSHAGSKVFTCEFCREEFRLKSQLENHLLLHTKDGTKYVCDCGKVFLNYRYLQKHRLVHARRERCIYCRKCFERAEDRIAHELLHQTGSLPVTKSNPAAKEIKNMLRIGCSHCDAMFRDEEEFAQHAVIHDPDYYNPSIKEEGEIEYNSVDDGNTQIIYCTEEGEVKNVINPEEWGFEYVEDSIVQQESISYETVAEV
ncbi:zinc finger protein 436-like isoform X3 [Artemia franciscana]|uniref:Zinc finger protein n=1 Tax=Artemia franciscana TaxID=6661 RepID=A0AA88IGZ4_ARTSF|nr:hypothetical protein QYM36_007822 [Artemia franciscana]